jgi:S1-C subfamily serine protease
VLENCHIGYVLILSFAALKLHHTGGLLNDLDQNVRTRSNVEMMISAGRRSSLMVGTGAEPSGNRHDADIVTNNHVVAKGGRLEVTADSGTTYEAKLVGADPETDLALIKVGAAVDFAYVRLAESDPRIGDWVLAVGNPFGLGGTVTAGIVSARGRDIGAGSYDDFIQIDAPVNEGNSGGPTFNVTRAQQFVSHRPR